MKTKTEIDGQHPASNYLVVGDPDEPSTWHLRVRDISGRPDTKLMGDAWAALHDGFRGEKYEGPDKVEAALKLTALYHYENMATPDGEEPPASNRGSRGRVVINRAFESDGGWIHIVPKGELPNATAGIVQVLDDKSMDSILSNIQNARNRLGDNWPGIYGGREHFIYSPDQDSEALAWFKTFQKRSNGIWASEDGLTDIGREAIKNKRYKYTSFVADGNDLEKLDGNRYRVNAIETVGFTNLANGKELLTPITNRQVDEQTNAEGQGIQRLNRPAMSASDAIDSADPLTPGARAKRSAACEKWFETLGNVQRVAQKKSGHTMSFQWLWDHCKAEYPHIYEAAFGNIADDGPASSQAEADTALSESVQLANRVKGIVSMDFRTGWNFVEKNLPQIFNRQFFKPMAVVANRAKDEENNMAGVQKKALRHFFDLVVQTEVHLGIPKTQALTHVANRETTLTDLANYKISPREAFERDPGLKAKLLGAGSEGTTPDDVTVQANAQRLFNRLLTEKMSAGKSRLHATTVLMREEPILCKLINREITPKGAFVLEPKLRDLLK